MGGTRSDNQGRWLYWENPDPSSVRLRINTADKQVPLTAGRSKRAGVSAFRRRVRTEAAVRHLHMNCLFIVQGEGRGHMTQALALAAILRRGGHDVAAVLVGRDRTRDVPRFFRKTIGAPVHTFHSPAFQTDDSNRAVRLSRTVLGTLTSTRAFGKSLDVIGRNVAGYRPDLVVNFFEPLAGLYYRIHHPAVPMICIGHQYLAHHEAFPFPPRRPFSRRALRLFTDLTAAGATKRLALAFQPLPEADAPAEKNIAVVPPLLRAEVFDLPENCAEPFLLAYVLNSGYAQRIFEWHRTRPDTIVHCFWDNRSAPSRYSPVPHFTFHRLNDRTFLSMMARCQALICTAGFESVCEAMYLHKPVLTVPVEGHFEQACNARDAVNAGAGITSELFDIDQLLEYIPSRPTASGDFRSWVRSAPDVYLAEIEAAARMGPASPVLRPHEVFASLENGRSYGAG